jgi:hypothetical protein
MQRRTASWARAEQYGGGAACRWKGEEEGAAVLVEGKREERRLGGGGRAEQGEREGARRAEVRRRGASEETSLVGWAAAGPAGASLWEGGAARDSPRLSRGGAMGVMVVELPSVEELGLQGLRLLEELIPSSGWGGDKELGGV